MTDWRSRTDSAKSDRLIAILLRIDACFQLGALAAVMMPLSWMATIHEGIGLGVFPRDPIVQYLARSLSTLYALHGVITFVIAGDVARYRPLIQVWAMSFVALGVITILIDIAAALPLLWLLSEGPFVIVFGLVILCLCRSGGNDVNPLGD